MRRHTSYHGLAVNVAMDLEPFSGINPCGYEGLAVTDLLTLGVRTTPRDLAALLLPRLCAVAGFGEPSGVEAIEPVGVPAYGR